MKAWLYRDLLMSLGIVDATLDSLKYVLTQMGAGHSIVLVVGGAAEVNNCPPDSYVLLFSRRKGFIKLALETGLVFLVLTPPGEQVAGPNLGVPLDCIVFFFRPEQGIQLSSTSSPKQDLYPPPNVDETACLYVDLDCVLTPINMSKERS